ncbi:hypothetical protein ABIE89_006154 [Bradyrhizobium niftali]
MRTSAFALLQISLTCFPFGMTGPPIGRPLSQP